MKRRESGMRGCDGVAIITAMLITAMVVSVASLMLWREDVWARQVENITFKAQADAVGRAAIDWMADILAENSRKKVGRRIGENGPEKIPVFPVENGSLTGSITDVQGNFNLNSLTRGGQMSERYIAQFERLLDLLGLSPTLANAVADWIDADNDGRVPSGAEDAYYLGLDPPYKAANRPLVEINELYQIKGFTENVVEKLRPYVTALPGPSPVNVNSAGAVTLASVFDGLRIEDARSIVNYRRGGRFDNVNEFKKQLPKSVKTVHDQDISVSSRFYKCVSMAKFQRARARYEALIEVGAGAGAPRIVWMRSF